MPNHVTTRCIVTGPDEEVARFRAKMIVTLQDKDEFIGTLREPYTCFDFNQIIPMPEILWSSESSSVAEEGVILIMLRAEHRVAFADGGLVPTIDRIRQDVQMPERPIYEVADAFLTKHPRYEELGIKRLKAIVETGYSDWYSWSIAHWKTKWNSYSFELVSESPLEFTFDTAWSFPQPIFEKLTEEFPSLHFECSSFDEGWGFGADGFFNPPEGKQPFTYYRGGENNGEIPDGLYQKVYHEDPPVYEDEDTD